MSTPRQRTRRSTTATFGMAAALFAAVAVCDVWLLSGLSSPLVYIPAVMAAAWSARLWLPLVVAALAALLPLTVPVAASETTSAGATALWWQPVERIGVLVVIAVVTVQWRRAAERARNLSRTDSLTGLHNRRSLLERSAAELNRSQRTGRPLTVAYLDCDGFKAINDEHGHAAGDALLITIAETLTAHLRNYDLAARTGGDEFVLLLPETPAEAARSVIARVHDRLNTATAAVAPAATCSIGVVTFNAPPETADELVRHADEQMYEVKRAGKNAARYEVVG